MSSKTRRRLFHIGLFLVTNALVTSGLGQVLDRLATRFDFNKQKVELAMPMRGEAFDTLVLGNSVTEQSFDPTVVDPIAGTQSYNLAFGGQGFHSNELVLRHFLDHNDAPQLVVIGIFVNRPSDDAVLNPEIWVHLDAEERALHRQQYRVYEGRSMPLSAPVFNSVPAFRYRKSVDDAVKYLLRGEKRHVTFRRGFLATRFRMTAQPDLYPVDASLDVMGLQRLVDVATHAGARVVLYEPPTHPGLSAVTPARDDVLRQIDTFVSSNAGVLAFRSFNDDGSLDYAVDEWSSAHHLNEFGAERMSREQLGPWLAQYATPNISP